MKLLLLTNSYNTYISPAQGGGVANTLASPVDFQCNFNQVVKLPAYCQMGIRAVTVDDSAPDARRFYIELANLPIDTNVGNSGQGGKSHIIGGSTTDHLNYSSVDWIDLDNPAEITVSNIHVRIVNQDGRAMENFQGQTEVLIAYRQDPDRK